MSNRIKGEEVAALTATIRYIKISTRATIHLNVRNVGLGLDVQDGVLFRMLIELSTVFSLLNGDFFGGGGGT